MRSSILLAVVALLCTLGLIRPRIALYSYVWFGLMRPDYIAFAPGKFDLSMALAVVVILGSLRSLHNFGRLITPLPLMLVALQVPLLYSARFSIFPEYSLQVYYQFFRMSLMALMVPLMITDLPSFRTLFIVTAVSLGVPGFWFGSTGSLHGSRIYGGIGGFMGDNNSFAVGLVMALPFMWYARFLVKPLWAKAGVTALVLGSILTVILTYSRGAALALVVVLLLLIMQSKKRVLTLALIGISIIPIAGVVLGSYSERMSTIATYEEDSSAMSRIVQIGIAMQLWREHPMGIGIGDQVYLDMSRKYLPGIAEGGNVIVHNSFLQMLVHNGIFGFAIFMLMLFYAMWTCRRNYKRLKKAKREEYLYPASLLFSIVGYVVASQFHPRANFDFYYMILMYVAAWNGIQARLPAPAPQLPPGVILARVQPAAY